MPGLDAASCNLRAAACDWPTARGLRLADCGSQIRMQSDSPVHSPGHNDATCDVRRAVCDVADGGLSIALGTMMRRATCDVQSATADDCKLRVAACRMRPSGTMKMVCCVPSLTHKYTPRCSHLLGRALSQVAPRRNWGLVACDVLSCSRVRRGGTAGGAASFFAWTRGKQHSTHLAQPPWSVASSEPRAFSPPSAPPLFYYRTLEKPAFWSNR